MNDNNIQTLTATVLDNEMIMDWNDVIESDGPELVLLDDGDYNFRVVNYRCERFPGSAKIPPCNKAVVTMAVDTDEGTGIIYTDLILFRTLEWRLASFFRSIGQKKPGERLKMDWAKLPGSRGRARFKQRTYTDKNGEQHTINDVDRFYDYNPKYFPEDHPWVRTAESSSVDNWIKEVE